MRQEDLRRLIAGGESETVEFKNSFDKEVLETAGAFANTRGGIMLIGISDAKQVLGLQLGKETLKDWANQISQNSDLRIIPEIETSESDGRHVIMIPIKEFPNKPLMRRGWRYGSYRNVLRNYCLDVLFGQSKASYASPSC